jgi:HPt (histidine-containing phosphotransfer) domain-containing protein
MASPNTDSGPTGAATGGSAEVDAGWVALRQVLDAQALERLSELDPNGNNGVILRVLTAFEASLSRLMGQLVEARAANNVDVLRYVAHTLKSSSASVGALKLSRLCADIERMLRLQQSEGMDALLDDMVTESKVLVAALKRVLPSPP